VNTYDTYCEAPGCRESIVYRADNLDAAIEYVRFRGWLAEQNPRGYESYCPAHALERTLRGGDDE
jgi:hypothetical protein